MQQKRENNIKWMNEKQNIWKYAKPIFHAFSPPFRRITIDKDNKEKNPERIVDMFADDYEKHFAAPFHDILNPAHSQSIKVYEEMAEIPNLALEKIKYEEVLREWNKFRPKKSADSVNTSVLRPG